ncbi:MAG: DUF1365 domain-containing protein [Rubrivivax sp.]
MSTTEATPLLMRGEVRHRRLRPAEHAFSYPTGMLLLPMRRLREHPAPALARNRRALLSFHDCDHGDGGGDALAWIDALLQREGVHDAQGEVWLQTYPRLLGYVFKPVSFWYAHRSDGTLAAVVAEVNNTFGERHCYLLDGPGLGWGRELQARKVFHVSPFCRVQGRYRFRFMRRDDRIVARVDHDDEQGALLQTSVSGRLSPLDAAAARRLLLGMPLLTLAVIWRIHWQALRLVAKRVPFFGKPSPPQALTTR